MFALWLKGHQINDVDDANLQFGKMLAEKIHGGKRLQGWHIAGTSHHHLRFLILIIASPSPDADSGSCVLNGCIHVEILQRWLLPRNDDIHVVATPQTMLRDR